MKAIILAGGRGERLRPITDSVPKPLVPVLCRPVMDYTLQLLSHHGIKEAMVTTCYLSEIIKKNYKNGKFGVKLEYTDETTPLGTAGGVKKCENFLSDEKDFIVISGDALCDFDLTKAIKFHREKNSDVTIVLSSVTRPLEYGVVISEKDGSVSSFSEKPDWSEALSDSVNTGVYIISAEVLDSIPEGKFFDFSHDLFPAIMENGGKIYGYKDSGYWCDIGKIPEYYKCNLDLMNERCTFHASLSGKILENSRGRYFVSNGATVDEGAVINENSVISDGVDIKNGAKISGSIIMDNCTVEEDAIVKDSILCEGTKVGRGAAVVGESIIGKESEVTPDSVVSGGSFPPKTKFKSQNAFTHSDEFNFTELGAERGGYFLDDESIEKLGRACGKVFGKDILFMYDRQKPESEYYASLFSAGILRSGANAVNIGKGDRDIASFYAARKVKPAFFITSQENGVRVFGYESDSLPLYRETVIKLSKVRFDEVSDMTGTLKHDSDAEKEYMEAVCEELGEGKMTPFGIFGRDRAEMFGKCAIKNGYRAYNEKKDGMISIGIHGDSAEVFLGDEKIFDTERMRLFVIKEMIAEGKRLFYLPKNSPYIFKETIEKSGGKVRFFSLGYTNSDETEERNGARNNRFTFDSMFLAAKFLKYTSKIGKTVIRNVFEGTPMFYVSTITYVPDEKTRLKLVGMASPQFNEKKIRIFPETHTIKIMSEAASFEAALDNAFECRGKLNEIEQKIKGR